MIALFNEWLTEKHLFRLASLDGFDVLDPHNIKAVLEQFATCRADSVSIQRAKIYQQALTKIWELANEQYSKDKIHSRHWLTVMASCNALYETYEPISRKQYEEALAA